MKQLGSVQMKRNDVPTAMENRLGTNAHLPMYLSLAMSKTPHTQYLCMFARHGNLFYHSKFIVTTSSKWYN